MVEWHLLKFFESQSVSFLQQTSLWQTVGELDSRIDFINDEWIYKECKAWF